MLVGSIVPTAGSVRLDMMDLRNWDPRQFGENVGYLPQDVQLFPATIKANIARMRDDACDEDIFDAAEAGRRARDDLAASRRATRPSSAWMAARCRAASGSASVWRARSSAIRACVVLDEPNSNLDPFRRAGAGQALLRAKEKQITVVAITQRPALLKSVDKIMIIKGGGAGVRQSRRDHSDDYRPQAEQRSRTGRAILLH